MSNIYIQEPLTTGKVLLKTTVGDIDIELWTKEAPKTCRNFIQLCLEGYYNNTIFHRVVKDFIVQGGDPNGDGTGGVSIYGEPFKDEFHQRLRFVRRGLIAMANAGKDDNGSQFFFTLNATPELQNKHTIFGKVAGETLFNMLKLGEGLVDAEEKPLYPNKILKTEVLINPFDDIVPRKVHTQNEKKVAKKTRNECGVKNFKLLSFGEEAQEDEEMTVAAIENFTRKNKSTHDLLNDPKLSSVPIDTEVQNCNTENIQIEIGENLKTKQNKEHPENTEEDEEDIGNYRLGDDRAAEKKVKIESIKKEIKLLKRNYQDQKKEASNEVPIKQMKNDTIDEYFKDQEKYKSMKGSVSKKGSSREAHTLQLLEKFKKRLVTVKDKSENETEDGEEKETEDIGEDDWMNHKLHFQDTAPVLARDANTKGNDWFEIYDPRNPINKRRREQSKTNLSKKVSH